MAGLDHVEVAGETVGEVLEALDQQFPGIKDRLCRDGALLPGWQVSIDDVMTMRGLRAKLRPQSEVHFLPAIGGG